MLPFMELIFARIMWSAHAVLLLELEMPVN